MVYFSVFFCAICFWVAMTTLFEVRKQLAWQQEESRKALEALSADMAELLEAYERQRQNSNHNWEATVNALDDVCAGINKAHGSANSYIEYSVGLMKHTLCCLRPMVIDYQIAAEEEEEYEEAVKFRRIVSQIDMILNYNDTTDTYGKSDDE